MKTPLEQVREAVIAAVPEIMELAFGCEVLAFKTDPSVSDTVATFLSFQQEEPYNAILFFHKESCPFVNSHFAPQDYKILGRPIKLSDVLRAIGRREDKIRLGLDGTFHVFHPVSATWLRFEGWDLTKDDLSFQSEDTIKFLAELLMQ